MSDYLVPIQRYRDLEANPSKPVGYAPPAWMDTCLERFLNQIHRPEGYGDVYENPRYLEICWTWTGKVRRDGRAYFEGAGRRTPIHKFAWLLWRGPLADGYVARPVTCGIPLCLRPEHLRTRPANCYHRQLSTKEIEDIRWFGNHEDDPWTEHKLAENWGVSRAAIRRILGRDLT